MVTLKKITDVYPMYLIYDRLQGAMYICRRLRDGQAGYLLIIADVYKIHAYFDCLQYVWTVQSDSMTLVQDLLAGQQFILTERTL